MPEIENSRERVIMKITGVLVDILMQLCPEVYGLYVVYEDNHEVLYIEVIHALYRMLVAALMFYKKFRKDLKGIGFKFNSYDPCMANRTV